MDQSADEEFEAGKARVIGAWNRALIIKLALSGFALIYLSIFSVNAGYYWLLALGAATYAAMWVAMLRWHLARNRRLRELDQRPNPSTP